MCQSNLRKTWNVFHEIMKSLHFYIAKIAPFKTRSPDFAILNANNYTILSQSHNVFVIAWSNDHRHFRQSTLGWRWNVFHEIMGSSHSYTTKIAPFVDKSSDFVNFTKIDYTFFTNFSHSYNSFVIMWSNDHRHMCQIKLWLRWTVFHEIMGSLHPYIANVPFVAKSPDFAFLTKKDHVISANLLHSHQFFVIM